MARRNRRHHQEESENHERWMISYADFITLLFAFFVVMYGISSVNEGKYRELALSIDQAFTPVNLENGQNTSKTILAVDERSSEEIKPIKLEPPTANAELDEQRIHLVETIIQEQRQLNEVSIEFQEVLEEFIDQKLVNVKNHDFWIELEMNSELLFLSGEAEVSKRAIPILKKVAELVNDMPNMISVEGYTDNQPINTPLFHSNWDLASARATSVVKQLVSENINPIRLSAVGYGEFHPVADNTSAEGRFKNRRVVLLVMSQVFSRYGITDADRASLLKLEPQASDAPEKSVTPVQTIPDAPNNPPASAPNANAVTAPLNNPVDVPKIN